MKTYIRLVLAAALPALATGAGHAAAEPTPPRPPIHFEPNVGQSAPEVKFLARGSQHGLFVTDSRLVLRLSGAEQDPKRRGTSPRGSEAVVSMDFVGARRPSSVSGLEPHAGVSHYLIGKDQSRWRTGVPQFGRVKLTGLYDGVDLVAYGSGDLFEYDFLVAAGANPEAIRLRFAGGTDMRVDDRGDLVIETEVGTLRQARPQAYQVIAGARRPVAARFQRLADGGMGFTLGKYDRRQPLVIDPVVHFSKRLGGTTDDYNDSIRDIVIDGSGNIYATGVTGDTDFPLHASAFQRTNRGGRDAFVAKFDANGNRLYSTYYGGDGYDDGKAIGVDSTGQAYVAGATDSSDLTIVNGLKTWFDSDGMESFVLVVNASGSGIVYSTYLGNGAAGHEIGAHEVSDLLVRSNTEIWLTGSTKGACCHPGIVVNGFQRTFGGGEWDAFVMTLNPTATPTSQVRLYTYYGGSGDDHATRIVQKTASATQYYIAGYSNSPDLRRNVDHGPVSRGVDGTNDGFVLAVPVSGSFYGGAITIGGSDDDRVKDVRFDSAGNQYVAGVTHSLDFPTTAGVSQTTNRGDHDGFVTKMNASGTAISYSTYLGGDWYDELNSILVTGNGIVYVTGETWSQDFPVTAGAFQSEQPSAPDIFLTKLNTLGRRTYSTYIGGTDVDRGFSLGMRNGVLYLGGEVGPTGFPGLPSAPSGDGLLMRLPPSVLFVVGNTTLNSGDTAIRTRLQNLGFTVTTKSATAALTADADGKDLVVVSSTITSSATGARFKASETPVIVLENAIQDDMAMTGPTVNVDYGVTNTQTRLVMITSTDPLSAGLTGTQTVTTSGKTYNWGKPGSNAVSVARLSADASKIAIYRYEAGKAMVGGYVAPERRVGFFVGDDAAASLTTSGGQLFDAAIKWAAGF